MGSGNAKRRRGRKWQNRDAEYEAAKASARAAGRPHSVTYATVARKHGVTAREGFIKYSRPVEIGARTARIKGYDRPEVWPIPTDTKNPPASGDTGG